MRSDPRLLQPRRHGRAAQLLPARGGGAPCRRAPAHELRERRGDDRGGGGGLRRGRVAPGCADPGAAPARHADRSAVERDRSEGGDHDDQIGPSEKSTRRSRAPCVGPRVAVPGRQGGGISARAERRDRAHRRARVRGPARQAGARVRVRRRVRYAQLPAPRVRCDVRGHHPRERRHDARLRCARGLRGAVEGDRARGVRPDPDAERDLRGRERARRSAPHPTCGSRSVGTAPAAQAGRAAVRHALHGASRGTVRGADRKDDGGRRRVARRGDVLVL